MPIGTQHRAAAPVTIEAMAAIRRLARRADPSSRQAADRLARQLVRSGLVELLPKDLGVRGLAVSDLGLRRLTLATDAVGAVLVPLEDALAPGEGMHLADLADRLTSALRPRPRPWWLE